MSHTINDFEFETEDGAIIGGCENVSSDNIELTINDCGDYLTARMTHVELEELIEHLQSFL